MNPSRSRIGRDIWPACVTSTGVPRLGRLAGARGDERAVGAAPAGRRERRAAEEEQAERGVRGVAGGDRLAVDEGEERRADRRPRARSRPLPARSRPRRRCRRTPRAGCAAPCTSSSTDATAAGRCAFRGLGHARRRLEHHPDRDRLVLVGEDPERGEPLDEVGRRARVAELPLGAAAAARRAGAPGSPRPRPRPRPASSRTRCTVALCGPVPVPR